MLAGSAGQFSFGHMAFMGLGAYTTALFCHYLFISPEPTGICTEFALGSNYLVIKNPIGVTSTTLAQDCLAQAMEKWEPKDLFQLAKCNRDTWVRNWQRNETLINLDKIPDEIRDNILREFKNAQTGDRSKLFNYFVEKKLNNLIQSIGDF